jgi:ribosomal protein S18 acetylase RimI-like enzyme
MMMEYYSGGWDVEIIPYAPHYRANLERISREWFSEYHFQVEPFDQQLFEDPVRHIIAPGGAVFFARCCKHEIVGTCGVMKHSKPDEPDEFELIKLGVCRPFRGMRIGQRLVEHALAHIKRAGGQGAILYTHTKLGNACRLYRKLGFIEEHMRDGCPYKKANLFMRLSW